eukprot:4934613-Pyramimonas_sp.AAC.1
MGPSGGGGVVGGGDGGTPLGGGVALLSVGATPRSCRLKSLSGVVEGLDEVCDLSPKEQAASSHA